MADINRRALFGATVAVAAVAVPVAAIANPADAEALELEREYIAAARAADEATAEMHRLLGQWAKPELPKVLAPRAGDFKIPGLPEPDGWGRPTLYSEVDVRKAKKAIDPNHPEAEWQASRCDQLIKGIKDYWRQWDRSRKACGLHEASVRASLLDEKLVDLTTRIVTRPAKTAADTRTLARIALRGLPTKDQTWEEEVAAKALTALIGEA